MLLTRRKEEVFTNGLRYVDNYDVRQSGKRGRIACRKKGKEFF